MLLSLLSKSRTRGGGGTEQGSVASPCVRIRKCFILEEPDEERVVFPRISDKCRLSAVCYSWGFKFSPGESGVEVWLQDC